MGNALKTIFDSGVQVHASSENQSMTGFDWDLSDEAKKTIDEIESNIRSAEQIGGRLVAG
ncbi:hypothetical protein NB311A_07318 [Nitrobacter sp. Nb-311A]|uniref:hypothetical protein n=1 Tax=Nitrobacter sp. Nb-311A TaxID=314253 RepID=UPI0000684B98|nr:hypothetical protein [Nitrobacter sp. Nb-311A]EAQ36940.1 hypothetical protein NB311A_07318 [Nitrobacter sp. Nb-311A]